MQKPAATSDPAHQDAPKTTKQNGKRSIANVDEPEEPVAKKTNHEQVTKTTRRNSPKPDRRISPKPNGKAARAASPASTVAAAPTQTSSTSTAAAVPTETSSTSTAPPAAKGKGKGKGKRSINEVDEPEGPASKTAKTASESTRPAHRSSQKPRGRTSRSASKNARSKSRSVEPGTATQSEERGREAPLDTIPEEDAEASEANTQTAAALPAEDGAPNTRPTDQSAPETTTPVLRPEPVALAKRVKYIRGLMCEGLTIFDAAAISADDHKMPSDSTDRQDDIPYNVNPNITCEDVSEVLESIDQPVGPPPEDYSKAVTAPNTVTKGPWSEKHLMESPDSEFAKAGTEVGRSLTKMLSQPLAWECLTREERESLLELLPPRQPADANLSQFEYVKKCMNTDTFKSDAAQYCRDMQAGLMDSDYLRSCAEAMERRAAGEFEDFLDKRVVENWMPNEDEDDEDEDEAEDANAHASDAEEDDYGEDEGDDGDDDRYEGGEEA